MSPASAGGFFTTKPPGTPWAHFLSLPKPYFPFCEKDVIIGLLEEFKKLQAWDFPGGPVVQTPSSQCREHGFDPWLGILPAAWRGQKKKLCACEGSGRASCCYCCYYQHHQPRDICPSGPRRPGITCFKQNWNHTGREVEGVLQTERTTR